MAKEFRDPSEAEIVALAISLEEEDGRICNEFADGLRERYRPVRRCSTRCSARNPTIVPVRVRGNSGGAWRRAGLISGLLIGSA